VPITPDAKNWTWVLDRPCPECGFEAAAFPREDAGRMIRDNAAAWQLVLGRPDVARRAHENIWSPLEYACHVRDVFRICDGLLALMLAEDDPTFANWDQDATGYPKRWPDLHGRVVRPLRDPRSDPSPRRYRRRRRR
jgi:hypothetical protein